MKIFIKILKIFFIINILTPFVYEAVVYSNYDDIVQSAFVEVGSMILLIVMTIFLTAFDSFPKMRYIYVTSAFVAVGLFFLILPYLNQFSSRLYIQKNEGKLLEVISEVRNKKIQWISTGDTSNNLGKVINVLEDMKIKNVQVTPDGSILFMEGGFMEANGWCYSENGIKPDNYVYSGWTSTEDPRYEKISFWEHSTGKWYRWAVR